MTYHITIGIVHHDKVIFILVDGSHQFIFHFIGTHLRFQVVSCNFRRRNQDAVFVIIRSFTTTVKEECYVSIFLCFGNMKLFLSVSSQILAQRISHVFLIKQDMHTLERSIVRSHTVVLQSRYCVHACFRHILLGQNYSQLFGTIVTIVEEDHHVTFFDSTVYTGIHNRFDKLVRYPFIIRFLHSLHHVGSFLTNAVYQQVIRFFHTFPAFVTVHSIITANDGSHFTGRLGAMRFQLFDKAFTALRVCVTSIHKAMNESVLNIIFFSNIAKFEQMVQRAMYATIRSQSHKMNILSVFFCVRES